MKFLYKKIPIIENFNPPVKKFVYRPIIPVYLKNEKDKKVGYEVLIDSGADHCVFHSDIAEIININWQEGEKISLSGIGGKKITGFINSVEIEIGGKTNKTKIIFSSEIPSFGYGILGQKGFFEFFRIRFVYKKKIIQITPEERK